MSSSPLALSSHDIPLVKSYKIVKYGHVQAEHFSNKNQINSPIIIHKTFIIAIIRHFY